MVALRFWLAGDGEQTTIDRDCHRCPRRDRRRPPPFGGSQRSRSSSSAPWPRRSGDDGPVPVIAALTKRADVPVYLDGVGTIRALNTVTVRPQVDGKLLSVNLQRRPGRQARLRAGARSIPPPIRPPTTRRWRRRRRTRRRSPTRGIDLERYTRLVGHQLDRAPAARHAEGDGGAARGAGEARSGADRQRQGDPRLHHHRRADRRPHRHPPGRPGQHRARLRRDRHRRHHAASADLGAVHAAAAAARRRQPRLRRRRAAGRGVRRRQQDRDRHAASSRSSTTRSIRPPARSSSRPSFPIAICSSGPGSSSTCGC